MEAFYYDNWIRAPHYKYTYITPIHFKLKIVTSQVLITCHEIMDSRLRINHENYQNETLLMNFLDNKSCFYITILILRRTNRLSDFIQPLSNISITTEKQLLMLHNEVHFDLQKNLYFIAYFLQKIHMIVI